MGNRDNRFKFFKKIKNTYNKHFENFKEYFANNQNISFFKKNFKNKSFKNQSFKNKDFEDFSGVSSKSGGFEDFSGVSSKSGGFEDFSGVSSKSGGFEDFSGLGNKPNSFDSKYNFNDSIKDKYKKYLDSYDEESEKVHNYDYGPKFDLNETYEKFLKDSVVEENKELANVSQEYNHFNNDNKFKEIVPNQESVDEDVNSLSSFNDLFNIKNLKKRILKIDSKKNKEYFGIIISALIIFVILSSSFYFFIYSPYMGELDEAKTAKLNELNSYYKDSLAINSNFFTLKNSIENADNLDKIDSIDVLRVATDDWRKYHLNKISSEKDDFGRIMLSYSSDNPKIIILNQSEANSFVNENDASILSNINFKKVDTVVVPVSISRLQAAAGLISVGDIIDVYSLNNGSEFSSSNDDFSGTSNESNESDDSSGSENEANKSSNSSIENSSNNDSINANNDLNSNSRVNSKNELNESPDISGVTVVSILRSKNAGEIDSSYSNSNNLVSGNESVPNENSSSFSTDVEELLKSSIFGAYSETSMDSLLDEYGIKLSNYERVSNIGELDSQYMLLLEVPRSDVDFVINNMDNLILTLPMDSAPNWVIQELVDIYGNQSQMNLANSSSF